MIFMAVIVSTPARLNFVLAVCRRSCSHKPGDPRPTAVKAVRGFFQGFPLYRKTFEVSRRRSRCRAVKVSNTSGVMGTTRVSPFLVLYGLNKS